MQFDDVACTVCGCVCDDLSLTVLDNKIVRAERACSLAEPWFLEQGERSPPLAEIDGEEATSESAFARAAGILSAAKAPLIYGLSRSSTAGQRSATRLADRLGATIDTTASLCHAPSIMALQEVGESTCSLGEIKNRADLVIFWGSNPALSHPRHLERYAADPVGMFVPEGRAGRKIVVVDVCETATTTLADWFVPLEPGRDFEAIWTLRALLQGKEMNSTPHEGLAALAELMKNCRCGVVFFGLGLAQGPAGHKNVEALLRLVTDLNGHTRFHAKRMRVYGDVAGADSVLCWQTGYPFSVNLARGFPRFNPGEYSANDLLERDEVDACLLVGSEGVAGLSPTARANLDRLPIIALDYPSVNSFVRPAVRFTTAVYGIHRPGTAYRMDEVPIPLRSVLTTHYPSDDEVLAQIAQRLAPCQL